MKFFIAAALLTAAIGVTNTCDGSGGSGGDSDGGSGSGSSAGAASGSGDGWRESGMAFYDPYVPHTVALVDGYSFEGNN